MQELIKRVNSKVKQRKSDLSMILWQTISLVIVVMTPTKQKKSNQNSYSRRRVVNLIEVIHLGAFWCVQNS